MGGAAFVRVGGHSVEEPHHPLDHGDARSCVAQEGLRDAVQSHEVQIEIVGRSSCGDSVVLRVDEIGADFEGVRVESAMGEGGEDRASGCCFTGTAVERG